MEALRNFHFDSLKVEQIECLQRVICLHEDILATLVMGFGKRLPVGVFEISACENPASLIALLR